MRHVLITAACLLFPCIALSAPADSTTAPERANSLRPGAWALQFSIGSGFYENQLSAKRHFTRRTAVRFDFALSTRSGSSEISIDTTLTLESEDTDRDAFSTRIDLIVQHYVNPSSPAQFYLGVGPFFQYSDEKQDGSRHIADPNYGPSYDYLYEYESLAGGVTFLVGAEWFVSRSLSLFTDYNLEGGYSRSQRTETLDPTGAYATLYRTIDFDDWFLRTGSARFGVGFYF